MTRTPRIAAVVLLLAAFCPTAPAGALQYRFTKTPGVAVDILTADEFERRHGANAELPRSDEAVVSLARSIFRPHGVRRPAVPPGEPCGEHALGLLFAALANPAVSDDARAAVDALYAGSVPLLPHSYTSGKFKVFYTDHNDNPNHNVTLQQVQRLAMYLNNAWYRFVTNGEFREPRHWHWLGEPRIDVRVYDIADYAGQTNSAWTHIDIDSVSAVRSLCLVKTVSAHELFHRVQYSYEYRSGTANMKWIVEGSATWAQRYAQYSVGDYMGWMNNGLSNPDRNLITARSYDAAHLWVFLQQRVAPSSASPIRQVWLNYAGNGRNARAALNSYTLNRFGPSFPFDAFVAWWHQANLTKDFTNAAPNYDYSEDERSVTSCSETYGPLAHVPHATGAIATNTTPAVSFTRFVAANGADYYEYTIGAGVTRVRVVANGQAGKSFAYSFMLSKSNRRLAGRSRTAEDYTYQENLTAGANDKLHIVVVGNTGGNYTLTIGP